ncbi:hypothetical protein ALQ39_200106 [Pseudomonas amygdali pv. eriobotryae]|uniref:Uncharacterized protein n=1 Tax=Pseudomonas amygdali pv. eriobotryae TaxID=129137 RepID=A0A3M3WKQ6_PSEA0|nr:hypothetical protein ALQ86_200188 [Pseudomonas amygdali pv. eriobotryae]RMO58321.1 hypothetical protein ALQ39_200106 [Pseudomonas amygdali pv. eriobotryae]
MLGVFVKQRNEFQAVIAQVGAAFVGDILVEIQRATWIERELAFYQVMKRYVVSVLEHVVHGDEDACAALPDTAMDMYPTVLG